MDKVGDVERAGFHRMSPESPEKRWKIFWNFT